MKTLEDMEIIQMRRKGKNMVSGVINILPRDEEFIIKYREGKSFPFVDLLEVRMEAIKHIKELEISKDRGNRLQSLLIKYRAEGKIDWIKNFFNITEDEL